MKTVRLRKNVVVEIIPEYALPVEKWYGSEFAMQCVIAPDDVEQGWVYDPELNSFSEAARPEPKPEPEPTLEERVETLENSKAEQTDVDELHEALNMILDGVTE